MTLTATATCRACDWAISGDPDTVDRAAERHSRTARHTTATEVRPA